MDYGSDALYVEMMERAFPRWRHWNRVWGADLYHEDGFLLLSLGSMEAAGFEHDSFACLRARGHHLERVGAGELAARFPAWRPGRYQDGYYNPVAGQASDILIRNNLFLNIRPTDGTERGGLIQILSGADKITIEHNVGFQGQHILLTDGVPSTNVIYRDNISPHNRYGIFGSGKGVGMATINYFLPGAIITNNVMAGGTARLYPPNNFFPESLENVRFVDLAGGNFALAPDSPYKGKASDGGDPGADMTVLNQVNQDVVAGVLSSTLARRIDRTKPVIQRASR